MQRYLWRLRQRIETSPARLEWLQRHHAEGDGRIEESPGNTEEDPDVGHEREAEDN